MTEFSSQIICKNESFLEENNLHGQDPIYSNILDRKCGEIMLLANTKFWFLCAYCNERFHSIIVFRKHIKNVHITDAEDVNNIKDENTLELHANEKFMIKLVAESDGISNSNDQVDIEENYCSKTNEHNLDGDAEIKAFNNELQDLVIVNRSDSNEIEEILPTQTNMIQKCTKDCKIEEGEIFIPEIKNRTLTSDDIVPASKDLPKKLKRGRKVLSCSYCQHIARDKTTLEAHMKLNHDTVTRFQCEQCGKCFGNRSNLRSHLVIHSGTRPYKCDFCDAGFSHSNSLKAHRYLHTGNRPYKCIECNKGFVSSGALKIHMREHTGETPYVCEFCQKAFATQCSYKRHMISHSGRRAYKCKQCEKAFIHKETLTKHMASHSNEKKFVCDTCPKKFNCKKNLTQHKQLHLNIKQYICKVCNKDFAQNAGLYSHMKFHKNKK